MKHHFAQPKKGENSARKSGKRGRVFQKRAKNSQYKFWAIKKRKPEKRKSSGRTDELVTDAMYTTNIYSVEEPM